MSPEGHTPTRPADPEMVQALRAIVGPGWVRDSAVDRLAYARDCWPRLTVQARDGRPLRTPSCVVQPADEGEVVELVRWAEARNLPLIPYGAGSGVCGGTVPLSEAVIVDLKRIRHLEVDRERAQARIGPGAIGQHAETALNRQGYTLGHYPSSLYCSTIGGYLAGRSAGQYSSRYGKIEDMVASLRAVVGGGTVVDTAAAPSRGGLDLLQLLVGSEGTLGIITDSTLRIHPKPTTRWYRGYMMSGVAAGAEVMRDIMQAGLRPAVLRLYDELDTLMAGGRGSPAQRTGEKSQLYDRILQRARRAVRRALDQSSLHELADRVSRVAMGRVLGKPLLLDQAIKLLPGRCLLIVGFEGTEAEVELESRLANDIALRHGVDLGAGPGEHWYAHRFAISYKMSPMMDTGAFIDTMEVSTTWSNLMDLYGTVRAAMSPHVLVMAHFSHAYHDGGSIYFTFAGFEPDLDALLALYDRAWTAGLDAVAATGSSIAHHHGVGLSKAAWVPADHHGGAPLMRALRATLDPAGVFNPGKVWLEPSPGGGTC